MSHIPAWKRFIYSRNVFIYIDISIALGRQKSWVFEATILSWNIMLALWAVLPLISLTIRVKWCDQECSLPLEGLEVLFVPGLVRQWLFVWKGTSCVKAGLMINGKLIFKDFENYFFSRFVETFLFKPIRLNLIGEDCSPDFYQM